MAHKALIMKPYFVKRLLEEEAVKPGDWALDLMTKETFIAGDHIQEMPELIRSQSKKIKFVLCSRSIKIGEEFTFPNGEKDIIDHFESILPLGVMVGKNPDNFIHCCDERCFKIIGDVSPDAYSFIQENQEFDEEDLRALERGGLSIRRLVKHIRPEYSQVEGGYPKIYVKGPCGHFH